MAIERNRIISSFKDRLPRLEFIIASTLISMNIDLQRQRQELNMLQTVESNSIWLGLTPAEIDAQPNPKIYTNQTSLDNAKLNQLCLIKFQAWLDEREIEHSLSFSLNELSTIWDVVTGYAIEIGTTRLILIPSDNLDRDGIRIPQEWVDLPNWLGDYYVGVQIDLDAGLINIWGFASHQTIKDRGEYRHCDRTYRLDSGKLVGNLDILWLATDLALNERAIVDEIPALSLDSALDTIRQLSIPSAYSPRSKLTFPEWGAILNNPTLRSQLHETRLQRAAITQTPVASFSLVDWVRNEFTNTIAAGWQNLQTAQSVTLSSNIRETVNRAKLINLQLELQQQTVVLLIGVVPETNDSAEPTLRERMRVVVQVYPSAAARCLPPQLQLSYLDENGFILRQVIARNNDNFIQLPAYTCPLGTELNIQLKLNDSRIVERVTV